MAEAAGSGSDDDSDQLVTIHEAAKCCNASQLRRALAAGVSPNLMSPIGRSAIHDLCLPNESNLEARLACLDLLRQSPGFDVNLPNSYGERAIHLLWWIVISRHQEINFFGPQ